MSILNKLKFNVKDIKLQTMNLKNEHRLFLYFLVGVILGTLMLNLYGRNGSNNISIYNEYLTDGLVYSKVNKWSYSIYCFKSYICEFGILLLLNLTPFDKLFNRGYLIYKGLNVGIIISSTTLTYGCGGLLIYLLSIFPHYFIYVPFVIASLYVSMHLSKMIKERNNKKGYKAVVLIIAMAFFTSMLEAYVNYPILSYFFG